MSIISCFSQKFESPNILIYLINLVECKLGDSRGGATVLYKFLINHNILLKFFINNVLYKIAYISQFADKFPYKSSSIKIPYKLSSI